MTFKEWLNEEGKKSYTKFREDMIIDGFSHDEIQEQWSEVEEEYSDYCDENDIIPEWE
jgi:hypothetical protein